MMIIGGIKIVKNDKWEALISNLVKKNKERTKEYFGEGKRKKIAWSRSQRIIHFIKEFARLRICLFHNMFC